MPQVIPSPKVYDAVIVGSGAGGGMAAYVLTRAGAKCLMLEAGRWYDTAKESKMMEWNYDKTEELIGVFGSHEGVENTPDGKFLPPPKPRCYELVVQKACQKLGIPCIPSRLSILTRPLNGRPACHYCAQCGRSCATGSNFSSPTVLLPPALATGNP